VIEFTAGVRIARPIEEVFAYVSDPLNFPRWNSAVQAVRNTSQSEGEVGARCVMERELPTGRAENELEIVAWERPKEFAIHTTSGPTPFVYRYSFASENGETVIELAAAFELGGVAALVAPLARRAVREGVDENFATLKMILEHQPH
jgi:uncharacterized protein YndB with AHSA1/START domain